MPFAMMRRNRRVCERSRSSRAHAGRKIEKHVVGAFFWTLQKTAWQPDEQIAMPDVYAGIP